MVMPNLYGNIVSNIGAALVGGPGIVPGCNIGRVRCPAGEAEDQERARLTRRGHSAGVRAVRAGMSAHWQGHYGHRRGQPGRDDPVRDHDAQAPGVRPPLLFRPGGPCADSSCSTPRAQPRGPGQQHCRGRVRRARRGQAQDGRHGRQDQDDRVYQGCHWQDLGRGRSGVGHTQKGGEGRGGAGPAAKRGRVGAARCGPWRCSDDRCFSSVVRGT